jgi:hypothetical protein
VARVPFNFFTEGASGTTPEGDDFLDKTAAHDAGVDGDVVLYYLKPKAPEAQIAGVFVSPVPAGVRLFAANFTGGGTLTERQVSTDTYDATLGDDDHAKAQVLGFLPPPTRGIAGNAVCGLYHMLLWIEDRAQSASFLGGGALMSLRYNKAHAEAGATASRLVSDADAFTPSITGTGWPVQADFMAGDSVSFPVGFGFDQTVCGLYFTQFGEIYYTEYNPASGLWWQDASGLPAPTLLSNEGFPGMPNAFLQAVTGEDTAMFGIGVFGNYILQEFPGTVGPAATPITVRRYDSMHKALIFYAKDDGGWDSENDGTGFNRLFCRIRE